MPPPGGCITHQTLIRLSLRGFQPLKGLTYGLLTMEKIAEPLEYFKDTGMKLASGKIVICSSYSSFTIVHHSINSLKDLSDHTQDKRLVQPITCDRSSYMYTTTVSELHTHLQMSSTPQHPFPKH